MADLWPLSRRNAGGIGAWAEPGTTIAGEKDEKTLEEVPGVHLEPVLGFWSASGGPLVPDELWGGAAGDGKSHFTEHKERAGDKECQCGQAVLWGGSHGGRGSRRC